MDLGSREKPGKEEWKRLTAAKHSVHAIETARRLIVETRLQQTVMAEQRHRPLLLMLLLLLSERLKRWDTGIRGLTRGMATLPEVTRSL